MREIDVPTELRHILFRPAEAILAVRDYYRRLQQPLPSGAVVSCAVETEEPGGAVRLRIKVALDPPGGLIYSKPSDATQKEFVIEGSSLAAALILYCNTQHIPLPAGADKSLQRFGEQLGLVVTVGSKRDGSDVTRMRI